MITILEQFHSIGYVYNDLKPDNICVGNYYKDEDQNKMLKEIKLIDFGLASPYLKSVINKDGEEMEVHIQKEKKKFSGNFAFSSKNAFRE